MVPMTPISQHIWDMKYRLKGADGRPVDKSIEDTWRRVAKALSQAEKTPDVWEQRFFDMMAAFQFLPAGRIIAGAGVDRNVTLFNCFVMGDIPDSMGGIFDSLKEAALTMQQGGGIGYDFSTLRPRGAVVKKIGADASGPLSFMDVWDSMCRTIMSAGSRRGAMMGVLRCDHPDIEAFIEAKQEPGRLRMFNLSVLVTDDFMAAVKANDSWDLTFEGETYKTLPARDLWEKVMRATYAYAEPGVIFIDRINRLNNLAYCETIHATNPCGEQPLPPYGACLLGSVNLARLVNDPFSDSADINIEALSRLVGTAVRLMDNVIDVSRFPLEAQKNEAQAKRRIGLGVTGLADALIMCGARYGSATAVRLTDAWMKAIERAAYLASVELAQEKGAFPLYDAEQYLKGETIQRLDQDVQDAIRAHGIRNALITSIAPTGTISLFADNVSSGLEPVFSFKYTRHVLQPDGTRKEEEVSDYAYRLFRKLRGDGAPLTDAFVDAQQLSPRDHLVMQAAVQAHIDSSISKTINCPEDITFEAFKDIYMEAYDLGLKGCTTYRPNDVTGAVLEVKPGKKAKAQPEQQVLPFDKPVAVKPKRGENAPGPVHYLTQPLERPGGLHGHTYKLHWPQSEHALYVTVNDIVDDSGRVRPFEIFINSKDVEHFAWTVGLCRMISAVFRRGGDVSFVVEELKNVFDPRGGNWVAGKYVPSLLAALGEVIERHMIATGFLKGGEQYHEPEPQAQVVNLTPQGLGTGEADEAPKRDSQHDHGHDHSAKPDSRLRFCPKCNQPGLIKQEGCDTCLECGYSKCG
ncbi:adenosylcobalamin-dependent ribonucleoside-diphosphate reductase [Magnetovibrio blakemorei]|uniref:Vitamin B12-dependent ribonucleotide reductase n=1 Tax=Magnetovibrio blakemorei TaxID=28181 RepID=A0A1E5QC27_9PROT|nr:adenosylcobalamin-dependent ribonucleoside-diphosphate reductase [Magnetovibrio blakemorei]OEJ69630.1 ribonucleoside-diphosphate reductase, adenosylcobalamin-dependent [Magnetovibrio blakemorei]